MGVGLFFGLAEKNKKCFVLVKFRTLIAHSEQANQICMYVVQCTNFLTLLEARLACTSLDRISLGSGQMGDRPTHAAPKSAPAAWMYYAPCVMINRS